MAENSCGSCEGLCVRVDRMLCLLEERAACKPLLVGMKELAVLLGVSVRSVYGLRDSGVLPPTLALPGIDRVQWRLADIEEWVRNGCPDWRNFCKGGNINN